MNGPTVSVVIPSYNHERFIGEAINSVLGQTLADLELIVIDDGSRDGSRALIRGYVEHDPRVMLVEQANAGAHAAINRGLGLARGQFLAILNSDDRFAPQRLARLHEVCAQGADFVVTAARLIDGDSRVIDDPDHWWNAMMRAFRDRACEVGSVDGLLFGNYTVSTSNFFFRRALFEVLGPLRAYRYVMDWDYALRAALHAPERFAYLADEPLLDYRLHGGNAILAGMPRSALEAAAVERRVLRRHYGIPPALLASQHRHQRLLRKHQVAAIAAQRDTEWERIVHDFEQRLVRATRGWEEAARGYEQAQYGWAETREALVGATDELDRTRLVIEQERRQLADTRHELELLRNSRSYRLGQALTAPLRWLRQQIHGSPLTEPTPGSGPAPTPAIPYVLLTPVPAPLSGEPLRLAVHLHLHYLDLLEEFIGYLGNIPVSFDLFVTVTQTAPALAAELGRRFPCVAVLEVENRGKDIGGFIAALNRFDLDRYDLVLKLHSKKSLNFDSYIRVVQALFGADVADGASWRRQLLDPVLGSPKAVAGVLDAFRADPALGMVGSAKYICEAPEADAAMYRELCRRLGVNPQVLFFAGTMFWIRGAVLERIRRAGFTPADFDPAASAAVEGTLEHGFERVFGALVADCGYAVGGIREAPR